MKRTLMVMLLATACRPAERANPLLEEAAAFHNEAISAATRVETRLDSLERAGTSIHRDSLRSLRLEIEAWEADVIEVPGFEHEEDHEQGHHHHDHRHETPVSLTPDQMRDLQRVLLERIHGIEKRLTQQSKRHESI